MEQFVIPLSSFDVALLPEGARDTSSPQFQEAVAEFFRQQIRDMGSNGVVTVTPGQISVGWVTAGLNPVEAAVAKLRRGQIREGAQLLELIRARSPDAPDVLYNLGVAASELGDLNRSIEVLSHLAEVEPEHVLGLVALGVALGRSGKYEEALKPLESAIELAPGESWARKNLGGILYRLGRKEEAREQLEAAVETAPQDAQGWVLLGDICVSLGDSNAGLSALEQARSLDPHGPIRDRADYLLNQLAGAALPRNAEGVNPAALAAMIKAVKRLKSMTPEEANRLTLAAALVGQDGLRLNDTDRVHRLEGIAEPLTGLEVACLIHAGIQLASPGEETGLPLQPEYHAATV